MHIILIRLTIIFVFMVALFLFLIPRANMRHHDPMATNPQPKYRPIRPELLPTKQRRSDPIKWLEPNSNNKYAVSESSFPHLTLSNVRPRPKAAIISLVRNQELEEMIQSMQHMEYRWNRKYQYPRVFFNDVPFTDEFKSASQNLTSSQCYYELVPRGHWSLPDWIDEERFMNGLE